MGWLDALLIAAAAGSAGFAAGMWRACGMLLVDSVKGRELCEKIADSAAEKIAREFLRRETQPAAGTN
ncbi:MAG: hypothetical protein ABSE45_14890 [Candidatus Acidiferrales bacterium]|jgi:hypothetical protein